MTREANDVVDVAIIGGGASGTLVAVHLLERSPCRVALVERGPTLAQGVAYSTRDPGHLLNVPAGGMSALHERPGHFVRWLRANGHEAGAGSFVARRTYGEYLRDVLAEAGLSSPESLTIVRDEAVDVRTGPGGATVELASGARLRAPRVVLALGNPPPADPPFARSCRSPRYVRDPWAPAALDGIGTGDRVLLVGTGLTAVDVALSLREGGHDARIDAISRHGLVPLSHRPPAHAPRPLRALPASPPSPTAARLVRWMREAARDITADGGDWRDAVNALRPWTPRLWGSLPIEERRRFVRHVSRYWEVHRHRMAPQVAAEIDRLRRLGALRIGAARVAALSEAPLGLDVTLDRQHGGRVTLRVGWVINCTGPDGDPARSREPLLRSLLERGAVVRDPLKLGLVASDDGALLDARGETPGVLWTLGPLLRGSLWETTAVPEIRSQAARLAARLTSSADTATPVR